MPNRDPKIDPRYDAAAMDHRYNFGKVGSEGPAAELLAELPDFYQDDDKLSLRERQYRDILHRLARAERGLAEIKVLHSLGEQGHCDRCEYPYPCLTVQAVHRARDVRPS